MNASDFYEAEAVREGATVKRGGTSWCWHRWDLDEVEGCYRYRSCGTCGRRTLRRVVFGLLSPGGLALAEDGPQDPPDDARRAAAPRTGGPAARTTAHR